MESAPPPTTTLERLPRISWAIVVVLCLSAAYVALQIVFVQPYLWPAGHGATLAGDARFAPGSGTGAMSFARPPDVSERLSLVLRDAAPGSPADLAGLEPGDEIVALGDSVHPRIDLAALASADPAEQLRRWREVYWTGLDGPLVIRVKGVSGSERAVTLERLPAWKQNRDIFRSWGRRHAGMTAQIIVFTGAAITLFALRSQDPAAALAVLALALCASGAGGPLMGSERILPPLVRELMTVFAWVAAPLAFPIVALAIAYFPTKSWALVRYPWLHALPFAAAAPMMLLSAGSAGFLAGSDMLTPIAVWDAQHPEAYFLSFAAALAVNVVAVGDGTWRCRRQATPNLRRRIRIAQWTALPGVVAYAVKVGAPVLTLLLLGREVAYPWSVSAFLQILILLPAFGVTYVVAVHRVLAPRVALRRSIQYALARRTLTALAVLPGIALITSLVRQKDMTLAMIVTGAPLFYSLTIAASIAALRYRDRARTWLDQRFFRDEYDAQKILTSLASRIRFETDPSDLATLVTSEIETALHPDLVAILATGIDDGMLTPVVVARGSAESLRLDGGLITMLRWSDEPLELALDDPRSPARRLPPDEQEWLECTGARLLVPVGASDRTLVAVMVLGEKRSGAPYTTDDRRLLSTVATQLGLGLDVARLRRRTTGPEVGSDVPTRLDVPAAAECSHCGRCEAEGTTVCPTDGTTLSLIPGLPHIVDAKYRIEQRLGRGGMGTVYRAHDLRLERDVALKVIRAELVGNAEARQRFRREAQIVARLQHPGIVTLFDFGALTNGAAYLVMEFVRGEDLRGALARAGRFDAVTAVRLLTAVCGAIEAAHREGILHRDLKPENILLPRGDIAAKVLDFGIAKLVQPLTPALSPGGGEGRGEGAEAPTMLTVEGSVIGTPAYMAPEQLRGDLADARTDIFSLGVIAYEMLTGTLPFGRGPLADIVLRQAQGTPRLSAAAVPDEIAGAIQTALQSDPARRPPSAQAFASLLQAALMTKGESGKISRQ